MQAPQEFVESVMALIERAKKTLDTSDYEVFEEDLKDALEEEGIL